MKEMAYIYHCERCKRRSRFNKMRQSETACLMCGGKIIYDEARIVEKIKPLVMPR
jgi:transcription initiation factor IIE alpha subunit